MSTFTGWNGPEHSNVRTKDILDLVRAYEDVLKEFDSYQKKLTFDNKPTSASSNPVLSGGIFDAIDAVDKKLNDYLKSSTANSDFVRKSEIANFRTESQVNSAISSALADYAKSSALADYLKTKDLSATDVIKEITSDVTKIKEVISKYDEKIQSEQFVASNVLTDIIQVTNEIVLTAKNVPAYIGGSDGEGVFYILGMIDGSYGSLYKDVGISGIAVVNFDNSTPFSALVQFATTLPDGGNSANCKGELAVLSNSNLEGLKFLLVHGTTNQTQPDDAMHHDNIYLAVQAKEWIPNFSSSDGKGMFSTINFSVNGINIAPVGTPNFLQNNAECTVVAKCSGYKGFNANNINISEKLKADTLELFKFATDNLRDLDDLNMLDSRKDFYENDLFIGDRRYDNIIIAKRPKFRTETAGGAIIESNALTEADVNKAELPVGCIVRWSRYTEVKKNLGVKNDEGHPNPLQDDGEDAYEITYVLTNVPAGYLACDGSTFKKEDYPDLYAALGNSNVLPIEDFSIIKASKYTADIKEDDKITLDSLDKKLSDLRNDMEAKDSEHDAAIAAEATERKIEDDKINTRVDNTNKALSGVYSELVKERSERIDRDTEIESKIGNYDSSISDMQDALSAERQARIDNDLSLSNRINSNANNIALTRSELAAEANERLHNESQINGRLARHEDLLSEHANEIKSEIRDREDADAELLELIKGNKEQTTGLENRLTNEIDNRLAKDAEQDDVLNNHADALRDLYNKSAGDTENIDKLNESIEKLSSDLDAETAAREKNVEQAKKQINKLNDKLDNEAEERKAADKELHDRIKKEVRHSKHAIAGVIDMLNKETEAREEGDADLRKSIDAEKQYRKQGDDGLDERLTKIEKRGGGGGISEEDLEKLDDLGERVQALEDWYEKPEEEPEEPGEDSEDTSEPEEPDEPEEEETEEKE